MSVTISRLYNSYSDAQAAISRLEAAGVKHGDISVLASNSDGWYKDDGRGKDSAFPDRDLDGKDDRAEGARTGAGVGAAVSLGVFATVGEGAPRWLGITAILAAIVLPGLGAAVGDSYSRPCRPGI